MTIEDRGGRACSSLVSVLVPVRDGEAYLDDALASIAAQTHEHLEVIVVDDGSRDASGDIARGWAARDRRFRVVHQEARGFVAASRRACAEARGAYVAAMGGDDVARPRRLELQLAALEEEGLDACGGGVAYFPEVTDGLRRYERWLNSLTTVERARRDLFVECPIGHPALFARAGAVSYRAVDWPEDYDLVLRLWAAGGRFRNVEDVVLDWRDHPERLARTDARYSLAAFARCKVHYLREHMLRGRPAVVWGSGPVGKLHARALIDAGVEIAAFVDVDARKIGRRIYGIPVVAHDNGPRGGVALGAVAGEAARRGCASSRPTRGAARGTTSSRSREEAAPIGQRPPSQSATGRGTSSRNWNRTACSIRRSRSRGSCRGRVAR